MTDPGGRFVSEPTFTNAISIHCALCGNRSSRERVSSIMKKPIACMLMTILTIHAASAQTSPAEKIRQQVGKIGNLSNVTVWMRDGHEYYGRIAQIDREDFSVNEVDLNQRITLRYQDVKKVRAGYGTTRNIRGQ